MAALVAGQVVTGVTSEAALTVSATLPGAPAAGNLLVAVHHTRGGTVTAPAGWSIAREEVQGGTTGRIAYKVAAAGESATVTFTTSATALQTLTVIEVAGCLADQSTVLDQATGQNSGTTTTVTTLSTGTTGQTTAASGFAIGAFAHLGNPGAWANAWTNNFARATTALSGGVSGSLSAQTVATRPITGTGTFSTDESWPTAVRTMGLIAIFRAEEAAQDDLGYAWVGAVTTGGATVAGKTTTPGDVRLAVSTSPDLSAPTWFGPVTPDTNSLFKVAATGLAADTAYHYGVEVAGVLSPKAGQFTTHGAASFTFALASCARYRDNGEGTEQSPVSTHPVFDVIGTHDPLFLLHMGDLHYQDIATDDQAAFRAAFEVVLTSEKQSTRWRNTPIVYTWSDHDYGANGSDGSTGSRPAARAVYRQAVPHYPLPETGAIYHAFTVGRVRMLVLDGRSEKTSQTATDSLSKTLLGLTQRQWLLDQLTAANADPAIALTVLVSDVPWIWSDVSGNAADDCWGAYQYERQLIADHITAEGMNGKVCLVAGDAHMVAIDDGTNNAWGGFPVFQAAALDRTGSVKGGPYSSGTFPNDSSVAGDSGQFGLFTVTDSGTELAVDWSGRRVGNGGTETVLTSHSFTVAADQPPPPLPGVQTIGGTLTAVGGTLTAA